jgi:hypothetical protein
MGKRGFFPGMHGALPVTLQYVFVARWLSTGTVSPLSYPTPDPFKSYSTHFSLYASRLSPSRLYNTHLFVKSVTRNCHSSYTLRAFSERERERERERDRPRYCHVHVTWHSWLAKAIGKCPHNITRLRFKNINMDLLCTRDCPHFYLCRS